MKYYLYFPHHKMFLSREWAQEWKRSVIPHFLVTSLDNAFSASRESILEISEDAFVLMFVFRIADEYEAGVIQIVNIMES